MSDRKVEQADHAARFWRSGLKGPIRLGSDEHLQIFCHVLLDTFNPYKPAVIDWPKLSDAERDRLVSLPIWDIAVRTEGKARMNMLTYAERLANPLLRKALELNSFEEGRHKEVLANLVAAYGIALQPEPVYPKHADAEWAYLITGYSECIDSFFAFGLFELAKRSGFFPPALVETFEPVMQEECRHILFYVNWAAWHRRNLPILRRLWFTLRVVGVWYCLIRERIETARGTGKQGFTASGHQSMGIDVNPADVLTICLEENDRRMAGYDARLVRPRIMPTLVRLALRFMRRPVPAKRPATERKDAPSR